MNSSHKSLLSNFFQFVKHPTPNPEAINPKGNFLLLWSTMFVFSMLCAIVTSCVMIFLPEGGSHRMGAFVNSIPTLQLIAYAVFIGPIIEEFSFRFALKPTKGAVSFGLAFWLIYGFNLFFSGQFGLPEWLFSFRTFQGLFSWIIGVGLVGLPFYLLSFNKNISAFCSKMIRQNFRLWMYSFAIMFGAIHLYNFENISEIWYLLPMLILPQLNAALFTSYFRLTMGFGYAVVAHILNNAVGISILIAFKYVSPELLEVIGSLDYGQLQFAAQSSLNSLAILSVVFMILFTGIFYYFNQVIIDYYNSKDLDPASRQSAAIKLSMLLPGLGQDFLDMKKSASQQYFLLILVSLTTCIPFVFPFTYVSVQNALIAFGMPLFGYCLLTYYSIYEIKNSGILQVQ